MLSTSFINFCASIPNRNNAGKQSVALRFGNQVLIPIEKPCQIHGAVPEPMPVLNAKLDEFSVLKPESAGKEPAPTSQAQQRFQRCIQETLTRLREHWAEPPEEMVLGVNPRKWEVAGQLADWMQTTLNEQGVQLAIVARQGGLQHKQHDKTGMLHAGLALYHPREQRWKIYNLIDSREGSSSRCDVQWTEPAGFFARQGGYRKDALLLIPDKQIGQRMHQALLNGDYQKLVFTRDYNLVSPPDSPTSLNCNKWVLLNILAAKHETYQPQQLLSRIREKYQAGRINVHPLKRLFAAQEPRVKADEVPWLAPIQTVTVESLMKSGLFEKTIFCHPRYENEK